MQKRILKISAATILLIILFRGPLFRATVNYKIIGEREITLFNDNQLISKLDKKENNQPKSLEELIKTTLKSTNKSLSFTTEDVPSDPNIVVNSGEANCIGYAALFCSIFQFLTEEQGEQNLYRAHHQIGNLYFLNLNLHTLFNHPFFKDHDFVSIEILNTGEKIFIDPSLSDYTGIERVRSTDDH